MATSSLITVGDYLRSSYTPDREYVDGMVLERNVGEQDHSYLQGELFSYFRDRRRSHQVWPFVELRLRVSETRFRIPDVCVFHGDRPVDAVPAQPPFLCIEVLSPDDRAIDLEERVSDYLAMGVSCVWVVNPRTRRGYVYTSDGMKEAKDGVLYTANPAFEVPLASFFD